MSFPQLFLCGGAKLPLSKSFDGRTRRHSLNLAGDNANVTIQLANIAEDFRQFLTPKVIDLLEIAAYVYAADCSIARIAEWTNQDGIENWERDFTFVIPVREPDFWSSDESKTLLRDVLSFLSNDQYRFSFEPLNRSCKEKNYGAMRPLEARSPLSSNRVIMFSGDLDSLAGAVESARDGDKVVLVSHRPVEAMSSRMKTLIDGLKKQFPDQLTYIPSLISSATTFEREPTQRTRSFLYAAVGAVIAQFLQLDGVRFFENGVMSIGLPTTDGAIRARTSRNTHPHTLHLLQRLCSAVTGRDLAFDNPYRFKTATEVLAGISDNGAAHLIPYTCSCTRLTYKPETQSHCGSCIPCVTRRIAITAACVFGRVA